MLLLLMCVVASRNLHEITNAFQILQPRWETEGKIVLLSVLHAFRHFRLFIGGKKSFIYVGLGRTFFLFLFFYLLSQPFSLVSPNQWKIKNFFFIKTYENKQSLKVETDPALFPHNI